MAIQLANRFSFFQPDNSIYDSVYIVSKETEPEYVRSFNTHHPSISSMVVCANRILFIEDTTLYVSNLHLSSIHRLTSLSIVSVACGVNHAAALDRNGKVYLIGSSPSAHRFDSTSFRFESFSLLLSIPSNTPLKLPRPVVQIACGSNHVLLLDNAGTIYTFGQNDAGQIPEVSDPFVESPQILPLPRGSNIACYENHSCAVCEDGIYFWPFSRQAKTESPSRIFRVNSLAFLSLRIRQVLCFHGFDVLLTQDGRLFGFRTISAGNALFPSTLPMGCLHALLPEQVVFRPLRHH